MINERLIEVDGAGICRCQSLASSERCVKEGMKSMGDQLHHNGRRWHAYQNAMAMPCRLIQFIPLDNFCTCNDWAQHNICCHLLAARNLPDFSGCPLPPLPIPAADQAVGINSKAVYHIATREPLGEDPQGELLRLQQARAQADRLAVQQRSVANPFVAKAHSITNAICRLLVGMPEGEAKERNIQVVEEMLDKMQQEAAAAGFQHTTRREQKKRTKANSRLRGLKDRVVKPLLSRNNNKKRRLEGGSQEEFPTLAKKGRPSTKVGPLLEGGRGSN